MFNFHKGDMSNEAIKKEIERLKRANETVDLSTLTPDKKTKEEVDANIKQMHRMVCTAQSSDKKLENGVKKTKRGKGLSKKTPVMIIETGVVYPSAKDCSKETGLSLNMIYKSNKFGVSYEGKTFKLLNHLNGELTGYGRYSPK